MTIGPSTVGSSALASTASSKSNSAGPSPPGAAGCASRSSLSIGVNSQPGVPRKRGISMAPSAAAARSRRGGGPARGGARGGGSQSGEVVALANRALHLQLDEAVHLDRVLHRQLLDDRLDEAVDDQLRRLLLAQPVGHEVEELLLADLRDRRLVADVDIVLADADRRVGVRAALLVEEERVADDLRLRAVRALGDLEQAAVRGAPAVLRDRLGEDVRRRVRRRVDDLAARVLVLAVAGERDRQDLAVGALAHQVDARVLHRE